jgi:hypothetical protein
MPAGGAHQIPFTALCVLATTAGPCGTFAPERHRPTLVCRRGAAPPTAEFVAGADHCTLTHGDGTPEGNVNAQPETVCWSLTRHTAAPSAVTVEFTVESCTVPPWGHMTVAAVVIIGVVTAVSPPP